MKRIVIVCAVAAVVLFGGRLLLSWGTWSSCTHDRGSAFVLAVEHLGGPPSMTDCVLLQLAAPPTTEAPDEISAPPPTTEPPPLETNPGGSPALHPNGDGTFHDSRWGKTDCAHGGCATYGPCPLGYPPASHFMCTTPTIPPEQWPRSP